MDWGRGFEYSVAGLIVLVVLASGPLVGALDFSAKRDLSGLGSGNATVEVVSAPSTVRLDEGGYGSDAYYLEVPTATVAVRNVTGRPVLAYSLSIPALGFRRTTSHFLSPDDRGDLRLAVEGTTFGPDEIHDTEYDGRLRIVLRSNGTERAVHEAAVTVEVTG